MSKHKRYVKDPEIFRKNIINVFDLKIKNNNISENLEKGIYNYTLEQCEKKKLIKKWSNDYFVIIYIQKVKTILFNIK